MGYYNISGGRRKLKAYWVSDYFQRDTEEAHKQWLNLEGYIGNLAMFNERQGFIRGIAAVKGGVDYGR